MKKEINDAMYKHNLGLSKYACDDNLAIYLKGEESDFRSPFFHDIDRIIYSLAFIRYQDKTQVFSLNNHDHITRRMIHIQLVSKIARTIGRALNLNEDLIEAAALAHDLGHTPFGHFGESILNKISLENNEGYFNHNVHSVRNLMYIESFGNGLNISVQVLDAILCHNGEIAKNSYSPREKTKEEFLNEYENCYKSREANLKLNPMTLEGCVVRVSDLIAYLGRDLDDAIRLNIINREDIPNDIKNVLGSTTSEIVNTIVLDIINNSFNKNSIILSKNIYEKMEELKKFNYENIYNKALSKKEKDEIENKFRSLFNKYIKDIETNNTSSSIINSYLKNMSDNYKNNTKERIVIDYIAGMTDSYLLNEYNKYFK